MNVKDINYVIQKDKTIMDVYKQIDSVSGKGAKVLFVSDSERKIVGSLTDGDCRRALIAGKSLDTLISDVMKKDFTSLKKDVYDIDTITKIKKLGLQLVPQLNDDGTLSAILDFTAGHSYIPVDAVLMAGGKGERLRPLTLDTPKPLLKIDGKPIIDYNVDNLLCYGINHINVTVNYLADQLESHFVEKGKEDNAQYTCIREPKFLGTMGAVRYIQNWHNDIVLLMNSDLFTNINLELFYREFVESGADMSVACVPYNVDIPYGIFDFDNENNVIGLKEKPSYNYYANAGIYLFKRDIIDLIPKDEMFHSTDMLELLMEQGRKVTHYTITGYWIDIGKPEDFKRVQEFARNINLARGL